MSRLVVFGDSYADLNYYTEPDCVRYPTWVELLATRLDREILSYAKSGTSLDFTMEKIYEYSLTNFNQDDIIIVCFTSFDRALRLCDEVDPGHQATLKYIIDGTLKSCADLNSEEERLLYRDKRAYEFMFQYLAIEELGEMKQFYMKHILKSFGVKHLTIRGFPDYYNGTDEFNLFTVSYNEFVGKSAPKNHYCDSYRLNHLSKDNHRILAVKTYNAIMNDKQLDYNGFKTEFINVN